MFCAILTVFVTKFQNKWLLLSGCDYFLRIQQGTCKHAPKLERSWKLSTQLCIYFNGWYIFWYVTVIELMKLFNYNTVELWIFNCLCKQQSETSKTLFSQIFALNCFLQGFLCFENEAVWACVTVAKYFTLQMYTWYITLIKYPPSLVNETWQ